MAEAASILILLMVAWIAFCATVQLGFTVYLLWESHKQPKFMMLPPDAMPKPPTGEASDQPRNYL